MVTLDQLLPPDELQAICRGHFSCINGKQSQTTIKSSTFLPIPQLGQAAPVDKVTYQIVTAEVGLPDAI